MRRTVALILIVIFALGMLSGCKAGENKVKYASDYPLSVDEKITNVNGKWSVKKCAKDGITYLSVSRYKYDKDPLDYVSIWVYDSAEDAKKVYDKEYNIYKTVGAKDVWDEGDGWFTGGNLEVSFGYKYTYVYCIKDNVLLSAVTGETEDPGGFIPQVPMTPIDKSIDRSTLKPYVIENANTIKNTVMKDVLGYK